MTTPPFNLIYIFQSSYKGVGSAGEEHRSSRRVWGRCLCGITSAPALQHRPVSPRLLSPECLRSPSLSPLGALLFGVIPGLYHGVLQEQPLMGRAARCAAPSPSTDLPAEPAPPPRALPSPRLYLKCLQKARSLEHGEHRVKHEPAVPCASRLCTNTLRGARPQGRNPL